MSLLKKLAGETAIYGMSSILGRLLNYVLLTPYLTRVFSPMSYGIISDMYAYVALLTVLFTYRMETAYFRFGSQPETRERAFSTASLLLIASTVGLGAMLTLAVPNLAQCIGYGDHPAYLYLFIGILALDTLAAIPFAALRLRNRPWHFAGLRILSILVNIGTLFFFLELCPRLEAAGIDWAGTLYHEDFRVGYVFLANFMASLVTFLPLMGTWRGLFGKFDKALAGRMVHYAAPLVISAVAGIINQFIGTPLLKYMGSGSVEENLAQVGLFNAAAKIAVLMTLFTQAFNYASEPFFFRHAQRADHQDITGRVAAAFTLAGSVVFLGILCFLDLIGFLIGPAFRSGLFILPYLLLANLFLGLFYIFSIWYKLADKTYLGGRISLIGTAITLLLNMVLIPRIGILGPPIAALSCYAFMAAAAAWTGQLHQPTPYPFGRMALLLGGAFAGYLALLASYTVLPEGLIFRTLAGGVIFSAYLLAILFLDRKNFRRWVKRN